MEARTYCGLLIPVAVSMMLMITPSYGGEEKPSEDTKSSQAFHQFLPIGESVNDATGSVNLTYSLVRLKGISSESGLNLSLQYLNGAKAMMGLPNNWRFNLPYVEPNQAVYLTGKRYIIDRDWQAASGYQSGLRYENNQGIQFKTLLPAEPLPHPYMVDGKDVSKILQVAYQFTMANGVTMYFDVKGKLLQQADRYGHTINYYYYDLARGLENNRLVRIEDSYGQSISLQYTSGEIIITLPNGAQSHINFTTHGIRSIVDPLGHRTDLTYGTYNNIPVVQQIHYPNGLHTVFRYTQIEYLDPLGRVGKLPAVLEWSHDDSNGFMDAKRYVYGKETNGATFTGKISGYRMAAGKDGLMESNNRGYLYDTAVYQLDQDNHIKTETDTKYNYLHMPIYQGIYQIDEQGHVLGEASTKNTYDIDPDQHARSTNYNKPIESVTSWCSGDGSSQSCIPLHKEEHKYDAYGNALHSAQYYHDDQGYHLRSAKDITYQAADWGELPSTETDIDGITGQQQITNTALTQDRKAIQSETLSYKTNTDSAELPWKVNQYTYDDQGRVTSHQVSWAKGADVPTGSIPSSQVRYDYAYLDSGNGGHHKLQTTKTDALGNKTTEVHLLDLPNQPLQKQTDALGHSVSYEYNALGLKTKATDAEGHAKTTVYQTLDQAGMNSVTQTDPGGYAVQKIVDGLGREIEQRDNGDPTAGGSKVSRVLQTTTYNAIGKPASQTDRLGLKTTMQYDSLGRVTVQKDPLGNVVETTYEPAKLKATTKENGVIRAVQWVDVFNQEVQKDLYSDSDDHNIDYIKRIKKAYNAGGKEIDNQSITVDKADPQKTHLLGEIKYQYNIEGKKAGIFFKGDDDISLDRHVQYDLLGNQLTYDKTTHYPGGQSYTQHGDIQHYDATGQLLSREHRDEANPKTVLWQEQYAYDAAGNMIRKTRPDGTIINYQYSPNGNKTEMSWPTGKIQYQYDATGQLTSESDGQQTLRYDYTLDGQQKQTTYPDQKTLRIEFDQYSRPIKVTDASGAVKTLSYTPQNLLEQVQYQGDHLTNHYGLDHHHNGVLTGFDLKGQQTLKESFSYNGFNLLDNQDVEDGQGNHIQTTYGYNPIGDVVRVEDVGRWSVAEPPLQRVKQYGYDSLDQLRQSTSTSTVAPGEQQTKQVRYTLDGNSNVIETADSQNNQPEKVTHSQYNALDQLQKPGLVFDKNGRITKTADGKTYRYNALDQLLTVTDSAGKELVSYGYYPNGILGKRTTPQGTETFYQKDDKDHNEQVNAIYDNTHQSWTTYLQVNGQRLASYQTK